MTLHHIVRRFCRGPHWETLEERPDGCYTPIAAFSEDEEPKESLWFEETP